VVYDFRDFLAVAERLAMSDDEGDQRSAVSRAYYAAFHRARAFVRAENYHPGRVRLDHREVWNALRYDADPARVSVGERGNVLLQFRRNADYDRQFAGVLATKVHEVVAEAKALVDAIDRL